eukprot:2551442-Prymnesium_polylepis.1
MRGQQELHTRRTSAQTCEIGLEFENACNRVGAIMCCQMNCAAKGQPIMKLSNMQRHCFDGGRVHSHDSFDHLHRAATFQGQGKRPHPPPVLKRLHEPRIEHLGSAVEQRKTHPVAPRGQRTMQWVNTVLMA